MAVRTPPMVNLGQTYTAIRCINVKFWCCTEIVVLLGVTFGKLNVDCCSLYVYHLHFYTFLRTLLTFFKRKFKCLVLLFGNYLVSAWSISAVQRVSSKIKCASLVLLWILLFGVERRWNLAPEAIWIWFQARTAVPSQWSLLNGKNVVEKTVYCKSA